MFILASGSPRRRELLQQIGAKFRVAVSDAAELKGDSYEPFELVRHNAEAKAEAVARMHKNLPVLGADTVVALEGRIFGKPRDEEEAKAMLKALSGKVHEVLTGIAWVKDGHTFSEVISTNVKFTQLAEAEIDRYVAGGEPMDKAGAYALQGGAAVFIEGIEGSYSNVVGLPLFATAALARRAGVDIYGRDDYGQGFAP